MTHFPLTESLGLKVQRAVIMNPICAYDDQAFSAIDASDLEAVLTKGKVLRNSNNNDVWMEGEDQYDTHTALLINIQPIQRKVEFETVVSKDLDKTVRLDTFIGKKVKITIEEVE